MYTNKGLVSPPGSASLGRCINSPAPDLRLPSSKAAVQQRSINLAVSSRGIAALRAVDPAIGQRFLQTAIPMRGRMIHDLNGKQRSQLYDKDGQVRPRLVAHGCTNVALDCPFVCVSFCQVNN